jgi:hypothetical protein
MTLICGMSTLFSRDFAPRFPRRALERGRSRARGGKMVNRKFFILYILLREG